MKGDFSFFSCIIQIQTLQMGLFFFGSNGNKRPLDTVLLLFPLFSEVVTLREQAVQRCQQDGSAATGA